MGGKTRVRFLVQRTHQNSFAPLAVLRAHLPKPAGRNCIAPLCLSACAKVVMCCAFFSVAKSQARFGQRRSSWQFISAVLVLSLPPPSSRRLSAQWWQVVILFMSAVSWAQIVKLFFPVLLRPSLFSLSRHPRHLRPLVVGLSVLLVVHPPPCARVFFCGQSPRFRVVVLPCSLLRVPAPSLLLVSASVRVCPFLFLLAVLRPCQALPPPFLLALVSGSHPRSWVLRVGRGSRRSCHLSSHSLGLLFQPR